MRGTYDSGVVAKLLGDGKNEHVDVGSDLDEDVGDLVDVEVAARGRQHNLHDGVRGRLTS